jgi:chromosomal replication initiation ATPase DnaA
MAQLWGAAIRNRPLSMECPNAPLPKPPSQPGPPVTIAAIQKIVSERFYMRELRNADLQLRNNRQAIVLPRQLAIYLARQLANATLVEIGFQFGGIHHSTVLHSINKIEEMRRSDEALNHIIMQSIAAAAS